GRPKATFSFREIVRNARLYRSVADRFCDLVEFRTDVVAERTGADHDRQRDEGSDETVFDSGRTGFVLVEARNELCHSVVPLTRVMTFIFDGFFSNRGTTLENIDFNRVKENGK